MIVPMLINTALKDGALVIEEGRNEIRLVTRKLGATVVLAKVDKEALYQLQRTPDMPATLAEATAKAQEAPVVDKQPEKVLADAPVPLPAQKPVRQRPALQLIQGGAA